ncbi:hypothetical protein JCM10212_006129 [Sporobolomyces blumeae]
MGRLVSLGSSPNSFVASSLDAAVDLLRARAHDNPRLDRTFLIGGAQLYNLALAPPPPCPPPSRPYIVERILLTRILTDYPDCDAFLHPFETDPRSEWTRAPHDDLVEWAGWDVPKGVQREKDRLIKGGEQGDKVVEYEFQMWVRRT